jgi:NAD(P) transhydrogenase subunit alpha
MKPGSVIFDLAVAQGGNVEGSVPDESRREAWREDHRLFQHPAHLPADTSALFARNLYNFLSAFWDKDAGKPVLRRGDHSQRHPADAGRQGCA